MTARPQTDRAAACGLAAARLEIGLGGGGPRRCELPPTTRTACGPAMPGSRWRTMTSSSSTRGRHSRRRLHGRSRASCPTGDPGTGPNRRMRSARSPGGIGVVDVFVLRRPCVQNEMATCGPSLTNETPRRHRSRRRLRAPASMRPERDGHVRPVPDKRDLDWNTGPALTSGQAPVKNDNRRWRQVIVDHRAEASSPFPRIRPENRQPTPAGTPMSATATARESSCT